MTLFLSSEKAAVWSSWRWRIKTVVQAASTAVGLEREHRYILPKPMPGESEAIAMWDETANPLRGKYTNRDDLARSLLDTESKNRSREDVDGISSFWLGL